MGGAARTRLPARQHRDGVDGHGVRDSRCHATVDGASTTRSAGERLGRIGEWGAFGESQTPQQSSKTRTHGNRKERR